MDFSRTGYLRQPTGVSPISANMSTIVNTSVAELNQRLRNSALAISFRTWRFTQICWVVIPLRIQSSGNSRLVRISSVMNIKECIGIDEYASGEHFVLPLWAFAVDCYIPFRTGKDRIECCPLAIPAFPRQ